MVRYIWGDLLNIKFLSSFSSRIVILSLVIIHSVNKSGGRLVGGSGHFGDAAMGPGPDTC